MVYLTQYSHFIGKNNYDWRRGWHGTVPFFQDKPSKPSQITLKPWWFHGFVAFRSQLRPRRFLCSEWKTSRCRSLPIGGLVRSWWTMTRSNPQMDSDIKTRGPQIVVYFYWQAFNFWATWFWPMPKYVQIIRKPSNFYAVQEYCTVSILASNHGYGWFHGHMHLPAVCASLNPMILWMVAKSCTSWEQQTNTLKQ